MSLLAEHFQLMARYNSFANQRLYSACASLADEEYRRIRSGSFQSIHRTLNHLLVADRIWLGRWTGVDSGITKLDAELYDNLPDLQAARIAEDERLQQFCASLDDERLGAIFSYRNTAGKPYEDKLAHLIAHLFNHQTHHRGQIHVMLSDAGAAPISLDLHRLLNP